MRERKGERKGKQKEYRKKKVFFVTWYKSRF